MVNDQPAEPIGSDVIIGIHDTLVDWFADSEDPISPPGVKDRGLVESAAARPFQSVGGVAAYDTIFGQAAALFHSLINNHAFYNGNKRVALVAAQVLLMQNKLWIDGVSDDDLFEFTRKAAAHELTADRGNEVEEITLWFGRYSRKAIKGEHRLEYSALDVASQFIQRRIEVMRRLAKT